MTESLHAFLSDEMRLDGHIEAPLGFMERWISNDAFEIGDLMADYRARSPRFQHKQEVRLGPPPYHDWHFEAKHDQGLEEPYQREQLRDRRRQRGCGYHRPPYKGDNFDDRRGNQTQDRGPKRLKVDFPKYSGGYPYEWLDRSTTTSKLMTSHFKRGCP